MHFRIAFERPNFNEVIYGLKRRNDSDKGDSNIREKVSNYFNASAGSNERYSGPWDWYRLTSLEDSRLRVDKDWGVNSEPWVAIADQSLTEMIIATANMFKEVLDKEPISIG